MSSALCNVFINPGGIGSLHIKRPSSPWHATDPSSNRTSTKNKEKPDVILKPN